jgi:hypothetical protein
MPVYCYRKVGSGELVEFYMTPDEMQARSDNGFITLDDGNEAVRDFQAEHAPRKRTRGESWPLESEAMGVHPDQIPEMKRLAKEHGVPTDFTPDGRAILRSRGHRKKFAETFGFWDRNGGYGDPQRR